MRRVKFKKGYQRKFIKNVLEKINCPSLRELIKRGFDVPYSTLKNYYSEARLLPEDLFISLGEIAKIDYNKLNVKFLDENWGQIKGGMKSQKAN